MINESLKAGFKLHNILVWEKNNCTPSQFYMKNCEYVLFLRKGKAKWINDIGGSKTVHSFNNIIGNKKHPTEKPVDLLEFYIKNSSNEGDLVFDPFMGCGSTAIASLVSNRNYLGFEVDEEYYNTSQERINTYNIEQSKIQSLITSNSDFMLLGT
jgi:site-specific DNA-methyltransferase (adenine-specific)